MTVVGQTRKVAAFSNPAHGSMTENAMNRESARVCARRERIPQIAVVLRAAAMSQRPLRHAPTPMTGNAMNPAMAQGYAHVAQTRPTAVGQVPGRVEVTTAVSWPTMPFAMNRPMAADVRPALTTMTAPD